MSEVKEESDSVDAVLLSMTCAVYSSTSRPPGMRRRPPGATWARAIWCRWAAVSPAPSRSPRRSHLSSQKSKMVQHVTPGCCAQHSGGQQYMMCAGGSCPPSAAAAASHAPAKLLSPHRWPKPDLSGCPRVRQRTAKHGRQFSLPLRSRFAPQPHKMHSHMLPHWQGRHSAAHSSSSPVHCGQALWPSSCIIHAGAQKGA